MFKTTVTEFEDYKILDGHIRLYDGATGEYSTAEKLGCVGALTLETEKKTIQKLCAGEVVKEVTKATKLNGTISAHVNPVVAAEMLGLDNKDLVEGVNGYSGSKNPRGIVTLKITDMFEEEIKYIAIPTVTFLNGLTVNIESGQEEVAMMETEFSAMRDDNGYFYYQAYDKDIAENEELKTKWITEFDSTLVKLDPVVGE